MSPGGSWRRALGVLVAACALPACARTYVWKGSDPVTAEPVELRAGELPGPRSWAGTWRSPQLGVLTLHQVEDSVTGLYEHPVGRCTVMGALQGEVRGDLLLVRWWEDHRDCGRDERLEGRGWFLWRPHPRVSGVHRLFGRWGYAWSDRAGGAWTAERRE